MAGGRTYPSFRPGQKLVSASQMQTVSDAAQRADNTTHGSGIHSLRTGLNHEALRVDPVQFPETPLLQRWAAVVDMTHAGDGTLLDDETLLLREVLNAGDAYNWASEDRVIGKPGMGLTTADFVGVVFPDQDDQNPPSEILPTSMTPICPMNIQAETEPLVWLPVPVVRQFRVMKVWDEFLECKTWNGDIEQQGADLIKVLRPLGLRVYETEYEENGVHGLITYTKNTSQSRTATRGDDVEIQVVVTRYKGDTIPGVHLIYAENSVAGGFDVTTEGATELTERVYWMDTNNRSRAWAEKFVPPENGRR